MVAVDILGPVPEVEHVNQYILVVINYLPTWVEAYHFQDHSASIVVEVLMDQFISQH